MQLNAENGEVQLSGACLPRKAKLPIDLNESISSDFVYLPKEVLFRDFYISSSDIYCFALLCLELHTNPRQRVFEMERLLTIEQFRSLDTSGILVTKLANSSYQKEFKQLLRKCLDGNLSARPSALELWSEHNRLMEKKSRRLGMVSGVVTHRHIWSNYRAHHKMKS